MKKEKSLLLGAVLVLLIGMGSTIYVHSIEAKTDKIEVNGKAYTIDQIFLIAEYRTLKLSNGNFSGIALDDFIRKIGIPNYKDKKYTFVGADGYQKTVEWKDLEKGIMLKDRKVVFSHLPKQYWVKDIVKIEVVE